VSLISPHPISPALQPASGAQLSSPRPSSSWFPIFVHFSIPLPLPHSRLHRRSHVQTLRKIQMTVPSVRQTLSTKHLPNSSAPRLLTLLRQTHSTTGRRTALPRSMTGCLRRTPTNVRSSRQTTPRRTPMNGTVVEEEEEEEGIRILLRSSKTG